MQELDHGDLRDLSQKLQPQATLAPIPGTPCISTDIASSTYPWFALYNYGSTDGTAFLSLLIHCTLSSVHLSVFLRTLACLLAPCPESSLIVFVSALFSPLSY